MPGFINLLVAITGGSGFIGRNLYKRLSKNDSIKIKIFDISPPKFKLRDCDIFIQGDIMEKKDCINLLKDVDIVFHNVSENRDVYIPNFYYYDLNEKGTQNLVEACLKKNVKKIIFKSTDKVYRRSADDNTKPKPQTFFGKSKLAA